MALQTESHGVAYLYHVVQILQGRAPKVKEELKFIGVDLLERGMFQPRRVIGPKALQELAESIRRHGVIEPIIVRPKTGDRFEIIAGERRWRGAQVAALHKVPCVVRKVSNEQAATMTLVENVQRENLRPIEEATGIQRLIDEFGLTHERLAQELGWQRTRVSQALRLLQLVPQVRRLVDGMDDEDSEPLLSRSHAEILAGLESYLQIECAQSVVNYGWTVRELELYCRSRLGKGKPAPAKVRPDPDIRRLEESISDSLGARVSISHTMKSGEGKITIGYYSLEELDGLLETLLRKRTQKSCSTQK